MSPQAMPGLSVQNQMSGLKQSKSMSRDQKSVNDVIVEPVNNDFFD